MSGPNRVMKCSVAPPNYPGQFNDSNPRYAEVTPLMLSQLSALRDLQCEELQVNQRLHAARLKAQQQVDRAEAEQLGRVWTEPNEVYAGSYVAPDDYNFMKTTLLVVILCALLSGLSGFVGYHFGRSASKPAEIVKPLRLIQPPNIYHG